MAPSTRYRISSSKCIKILSVGSGKIDLCAQAKTACKKAREQEEFFVDCHDVRIDKVRWILKAKLLATRKKS
jgi:hypothetical protein